ncbi:hypothetical protein PAXRUDRAFT_821213 [Paxillus rubicundulus Ve08.2h10]|uniref:Uncharacterized protein n=1 Tax=Paxillus rubicundulus Ve08.2h10 TaxID=930991 RepID=A0A0D0DPB6_9AGAM|nr:hypothetical protein PAXRUDRAFT_821213 [Paxillus rubicundulus Ve08.2h10]
MPPRTRKQRRDLSPDDEPPFVLGAVPEGPVVESEEDENVVVGDEDSDTGDENDENTPINDEDSFSRPPPLYSFDRSSSVLALRTPLSHSHGSQDMALRDITDQFFHPPSPSPVRVSKSLKRPAFHTIDPPRRPKKPKSLAYPADPPNWIHSQPSSSLPPSSPLPPSTSNVDYVRAAGPYHGHTPSARYEYDLGTPSNASDSDPFGFFVVERALKAKRAAVPAHARRKPPSRISAINSPPRSFVLTSAPQRAPPFSSFSRLDEPIPTNNEDIDDLYVDEPVAGPSRPHGPAAPLLATHSTQSLANIHTSHSQQTFPDPLRTPRKRKRLASPFFGDSFDDDGTDPPSSPSPVKISVGASSRRRPSTPMQNNTPAPKITRAQTNAGGKQPAEPSTTRAAATKRAKTSRQRVPTPSFTPSSHRPSDPSPPPTPIPRRRSARQAAVDAITRLKDRSSDIEGTGSRMRLRTRSTKANIEVKTKPKPTSKSKSVAKSKQKAKTATKSTTRGRLKSKASATEPKGKGKGKGKGETRPLENVLGMSDDTRERYEEERRERLDYFRRLEGYQIQKENVYVV